MPSVPGSPNPASTRNRKLSLTTAHFDLIEAPTNRPVYTANAGGLEIGRPNRDNIEGMYLRTAENDVERAVRPPAGRTPVCGRASSANYPCPCTS